MAARNRSNKISAANDKPVSTIGRLSSVEAMAGITKLAAITERLKRLYSATNSIRAITHCRA